MRNHLLRLCLAAVALVAFTTVGLAGGKAERKEKAEKHQKADKADAGKKAPKDKTVAPTTVTLNGMVRVNKDEKTGALKGVSIMASDGFEYQVKTGPEAKVLETMDGQDVEITGKAGEKKGGEKWLQVKEIKAGAKTPPAADGAKAIEKAL